MPLTRFWSIQPAGGALPSTPAGTRSSRFPAPSVMVNHCGRPAEVSACQGRVADPSPPTPWRWVGVTGAEGAAVIDTVAVAVAARPEAVRARSTIVWSPVVLQVWVTTGSVVV